MKTNPNRNHGLRDIPDKALAQKAATVYFGIKNNPSLAGTLPGLETFNETRLAFMAAMEKASCKLGHEIASKKADRRLLASQMASLKNQVSLLTDGEEAILKESGFEITRKNKPQPVNLQTKTTAAAKPNQFLLIVMLIKMVKGIRSYGHKAVINFL